jgi:hypothetical protein
MGKGYKGYKGYERFAIPPGYEGYEIMNGGYSA